MEIKSNALCITCVCGLARILPTADPQIGEVVTMSPCPRCGYPFRAVYKGDDKFEADF